MPQSVRMRFLAELFELPERNGGRASDVYWCILDYDGFVEFYSNTPKATDLLNNEMHKAEVNGILKQVTLGMGSTLRFLSRLLASLSTGMVKVIFFRHK